MSKGKINEAVVEARLAEIRQKKADALKAATSLRFQLERIEEHIKHLSGAESVLAELVGEAADVP